VRCCTESYTAAAAIQAGYLEDGLDVIRHIGLLNLRLGLFWAQNLWNPGFLTYVTAPVTVGLAFMAPLPLSLSLSLCVCVCLSCSD
jgi:hypothetical protein